MPFEQALEEHLDLRPGQALLDVGCGPGTFHERFRARLGTRLVGVDLSFGMVKEAHAAGHGVYAQADAQALPFPDARFDRLLASHMLFHVPDRELALREMRRVLRPSGRLVLGTNAANFMQRWDDLHAAAARSLGLEHAQSPVRHFTLDDLDLVQRVFPGATRQSIDSDLVFRDAEPALRYYASGMIDRMQNRPADGWHRPKLLPRMRDQIEAIIATEGEFRVAKTVGWFIADVK